MSTTARFQTLIVLGVGHCGSTLLGRLVDMHPAVHCFGETLRLGPALEEGRSCGCGAPIPDCELWGPLLPRLEAETGLAANRFRPESFRWLAEASGAQLAVDLSKTLAWRCTRRWRDERVGSVLLLRDPRGHVSSAIRRGGDPLLQIAKHRKWIPRLERLVRSRGARALVMYYEDLCRFPRTALQRLCDFMGLPFDERMLNPADQPHHFVHSSTSSYLAGSNKIRLDERWREELDPALRRKTEAMMAGLSLYRPLLDA
jgi:hypothetical protein